VGASDRDRSIDVGEFIGLDIAGGFAHARKHADRFGDRLFEPESSPQSAPVLAGIDESSVNVHPGRLREPDRLIEERHAAAAIKAGEENSAGLPKQLVALLDFGNERRRRDITTIKRGVCLLVRTLAHRLSESHRAPICGARASLRGREGHAPTDCIDNALRTGIASPSPRSKFPAKLARAIPR